MNQAAEVATLRKKRADLYKQLQEVDARLALLGASVRTNACLFVNIMEVGDGLLKSPLMELVNQHFHFEVALVSDMDKRVCDNAIYCLEAGARMPDDMADNIRNMRHKFGDLHSAVVVKVLYNFPAVREEEWRLSIHSENQGFPDARLFFLRVKNDLKSQRVDYINQTPVEFSQRMSDWFK
jgi:hypothetical protein